MKTLIMLLFTAAILNMNLSGTCKLNHAQAYEFECVKNYDGDKITKTERYYYHTFRNRLNNARVLFTDEKEGRVAFLGGSITANGGWRDSICIFLQDAFPETRFEFINAGIPSMGSTPGAFRFERDVLGHGKVDLLFMEAAVNDRVNGLSSKEQVLGMEGIVRHARESNPAIDVVIMHFVDPDKITEYRKGIVPPEIENHEKVAAHYAIPTINLAKEVTERIDNGEFTWKDDFKDLHPSPFGQHIYYRSMKSFLKKCWSNDVRKNNKVTFHPLPEKLSEACYNRGILIPAVELKAKSGWEINHCWTPADNVNSRPDFTHVPMLIKERSGGIFNYVFEGNAVGIAVASGPDAGMIEYRIDRGKWQKQDLFTQWSSRLHLPFFYTLGYGLGPGRHRLEIRVINEKNPESTGNACRIRYLYVNMPE